MILNDTLPNCLVDRLSDEALAIFLFHGVIERQCSLVRNYTGKHIEANLFARCMKQITQEGHAMTMDEVLAHCESGESFPKRAFTVTFDDGFENNISVAAPILADFKIPSMIYVTSNFIEENGMSWIDRIEYAVEAAPSQMLEVGWTKEIFPLTNTESRIRFLKAVRHYVKNDSTCDANSFADTLCAGLGYAGLVSTNDPLDCKMSWEQVRLANDSDLISIGGHSHTHAILSFLPSEQLSAEIDISLELLSEKAGVETIHYSYPEGLAHCYSEQVVNELKKRGVQCCPTAIDGLNTIHTDPFHLRRIMVNAA